MSVCRRVALHKHRYRPNSRPRIQRIHTSCILPLRIKARIKLFLEYRMRDEVLDVEFQFYFAKTLYWWHLSVKVYEEKFCWNGKSFLIIVTVIH